jgi:uncharacterized membrane protein YraQ (UPF0718 family)
MSSAALVLWGLCALAALVALRRGDGTARNGAMFAVGQLKVILPMLALALPAAGFIAELVPDRLAQALIGPDSGARGILIASFAGGLIPGGPFVSFPLVLAFAKSGAGVPQLVALTSGWAVLAFHRVMIWELPVMGGSFVVLRLAASVALPALSGFAAQALVDAGLLSGRIAP